MAIITIPSTKQQLADPEQISRFLEPFGIWYEKWTVNDAVGDGANQLSSDQILQAYGDQIQRLKTRGGYMTADVINVSPATPNLDGMLAKFSREHTHAEDEVRFIVQGRGVFHINPDRPDADVFAIQVEAGDMINVPAGTRHWFDLCAEKQIRAIRLFKETSGWTPQYLESGLHAAFQPLCFSASNSAGGPAHPDKVAF